jgi:hypothetical protein
MAADPDEDRFRGPDPFGEYEPAYRALRVYAFDPLRGRRGGNHLILRVPFEPLQPGPVGSRVAVVDEDLDGKRLHPPVDLNDPDVVRNGGLEPSDTNPHFHQQMVYAVISHLLRTFDHALGRQMRFRAARTAAVSRLMALPHGMKEANAYYSPTRVALAFGQFTATENGTGRNIPGQPVYSCLSHGIVVHETTHALLDGLRPKFVLSTSVDSMAFHEGFADIIALLQQLTFQEALLETIQRTGGRLYAASLQPELQGVDGGDAAGDRNPLISLGQQFGQALGGDALRSAVGGSQRVEKALEEPHARGTVMMNAVFEAFFHVYARRTRGLFRLSARTPSHDADLHPDLARRLAGDAAQLATTFLQLCIRAIAYCPAVDIAMGDYLRAMMTVHTRLDPDDRDGLRDALIDAFARRGIYPPDVDSMSESELIWKRPTGSLELPREVVRSLRTADAAGRRDTKAERELKTFCEAHRDALGLVPDVPLEISPFHQAIRFVGPELDVAEELVCQVIQTVRLKKDGATGSRVDRVYGGTTLIFSDDGRIGPLRYAITKRIDVRRQQAQAEWHTRSDKILQAQIAKLKRERDQRA